MMIKTILTITFLSFLPTTAFAKHKHSERYYQEIDCKKRKGQVEYRLRNGKRVDCLTKTKAIEYDFAAKWYECLSQALYYSMEMKKKAVCSLIVEKRRDFRHVKHARRLVQFYKLPVSIELITNYNNNSKS